MIRTRVGYAGGRKPNPTYRSLGDHTEAFEVQFDPDKISYEELLDIVWDEHDPSLPVWSRQYRNAIFTHSDGQRRIAEASREELAAASNIRVTTAIEPLHAFTPAEDYHQKYYLRRDGELLREYAAAYPRTEDLVRSTAAARVNGFLGGNGTVEDLERVIGALGLSESGTARLRDYVRTISPRRACPIPGRRLPSPR